tara:strand:+ start:108332 stop:108463 length:132 start_codon:yes stop_codon:yes gene_type:complete
MANAAQKEKQPGRMSIKNASTVQRGVNDTGDQQKTGFLIEKPA